MKNRDLAASVRLGIAGGEKGKGKEVIEAILFLLCLKIERVKSLEFEEASKRDNIENKCSLINKMYAKLSRLVFVYLDAQFWCYNFVCLVQLLQN